MERVAAMPDASLYVNRDGRRADDCVDSHGGGNLIKIPKSGGGTQKPLESSSRTIVFFLSYKSKLGKKRLSSFSSLPPSVTPPTTLLASAMSIKDFKVLNPLGKGAFASVFKVCSPCGSGW